VAPLEIHIDTKAVVAMNPKRIMFGDVPKKRMIRSAILWKVQSVSRITRNDCIQFLIGHDDKAATECVTDLDSRSDMIIFKSILTTF